MKLSEQLPHLKARVILALIARHGSMAKVADLLGSTASMVSRQIQALEEQAGVQLVVRTTRGLRLSNAGLQCLPACEALLDAAQAWPSKWQDGLHLHGRLRMSVPTALGFERFAKLVLRFRQQYPDVEIEIDARDEHLDMLRDDMDLILHIGDLPNSRYVAQALFETRGLLVMSRQQVSAIPEGLDWPTDPVSVSRSDALTAVLLPEWKEQPLQFESPNHATTQVISPRHAVYCNEWPMMRQLLRQMPSYAIIPDFVYKETKSVHGLHVLCPDWRTQPMHFYAMTPSRLSSSPIARAFVEMLSDELKTVSRS